MDGTINTLGVLSHAEIAAIMTARGIPMTTRSVWHTEHRAVLKLLADPELRSIAVQMGVIPDDDSAVCSYAATGAPRPGRPASCRSA